MSPTGTARSGWVRASRRPARKIAGSGLAAPRRGPPGGLAESRHVVRRSTIGRPPVELPDCPIVGPGHARLIAFDANLRECSTDEPSMRKHDDAAGVEEHRPAAELRVVD